MFRVIKYLLSLVFLLIIKIRHFLYKKQILNIQKFNTKIISIGNLSFGGTGKTPLSWILSNYFYNNLNLKNAVILKGYKSSLKSIFYIKKSDLSKSNETKIRKTIGDEANLVLNKISNDSYLIVSKNKTKGIASFLEKNSVDLIIIDDGFQHLKTHRDLDIVLIDSNMGFNDKLFPRGFLREPYTALKRCDFLIFTKSNFISIEEKSNFLLKVKKYNRNLKVFFSKSILSFSQSYDDFKLNDKKDINVLSSIAQPEFLYKLLEDMGLGIKKKFKYPDHYNFTCEDVMSIESNIGKGEYIFCTQKDWVKLKTLFKKDKDYTNYVVIDYEHKIDDEFFNELKGRVLNA